MYALRRFSLVIVLSLVVSLMPISLAVSAPGRQAFTPLQGQDRHGPLVILRVRALVPEKVTLSDPTQGTVQATVVAIDEEIPQVTVQTEAGQRLRLLLDPESLARVDVGTPCLLQVTNTSTRDTTRPPEHEGVFW